MLSDAKKTIIRKLQQKKYRHELGLCIVEGEKGVFEAIRSGVAVDFVVTAQSYRGAPVPMNIEVFELYDDEVQKLSATKTAPGILAVVQIPQPKAIIEGEPIIYLDAISDPGNFGTIIRTAEWFGIHNIVIGPGCVDPYNDKSLRASMGSLFRLHPISVSESFVKEKKEEGYAITGLVMSGDEDNTALQGKRIIIVGSESHGIDPSLETLLDTRYTIAGRGVTESLNAAIASAIVFSRMTI